VPRTFVIALSLAAALAAAPAGVLAQAWPAKPVKIVVPFSTGTAADIAARQLGARLAEIWGQGVVIENVMGAGGNIGAANVAKALPDGYTLLMVGINNVINPSLYKDVGYDMTRDFKPILRVAVAPLAIVAHPSLPANTIGELIALAKAKPKTLHYGSGGNGSVTHLVFELLKVKAGIDMVHVPYKGIAQMMTDIVGNQIPLGAPAAASALGHARAGRIKVLAVSSAVRSSQLPDTPTVTQAGIADFDVSAWNGLIAPAGTPDAIIAKVHADADKVVMAKEFAEAMQKLGLETDRLDPPAFRAFIAAELIKWAKLVKDSGAKLD
jgi:tripartite-type tricarboxylate transporter receptor subunit TctC